jgi:hypothetical protein
MAPPAFQGLAVSNQPAAPQLLLNPVPSPIQQRPPGAHIFGYCSSQLVIPLPVTT